MVTEYWVMARRRTLRLLVGIGLAGLVIGLVIGAVLWL